MSIWSSAVLAFVVVASSSSGAQHASTVSEPDPFLAPRTPDPATTQSPFLLRVSDPAPSSPFLLTRQSSAPGPSLFLLGRRAQARVESTFLLAPRGRVVSPFLLPPRSRVGESPFLLAPRSGVDESPFLLAPKLDTGHPFKLGPVGRSNSDATFLPQPAPQTHDPGESPFLLERDHTHSESPFLLGTPAEELVDW